MHADLRWLAENVSDWKDDYYKFIGALGFMVDWQFNCPQSINTYFTRAQWQAARYELISPFSSLEEDEAWQAAEKRMDIIGQNGNDGLHYNPEDVAFVRTEGKQPRYQDATGEDWIDEAARTFTAEEFRGAMKFTIGKYVRRMGKKDSLPHEIEKIRDYTARWLEVEKGR
jgi:hypothetical protein